MEDSSSRFFVGFHWFIGASRLARPQPLAGRWFQFSHHILPKPERNLPFGASFVDTPGAFARFAAVSVEFLPTKSSG
jgi:hypothetical protein